MTYKLRTQLLITIFIFFLASATAQTQSLHAGTKTPYPTPAQQYTPPPDGFTPAFVNYVGRHGARFFTRAGSDVEALKILQNAQQNKTLTSLGAQVLLMTKRFVNIQKGNYETITGLGRAEQMAIGKRMRSTYDAVFIGRGLNVFATRKVRTQLSAHAFLTGFSKYDGKIKDSIIPDRVDTMLRFYDLSSAYQAYEKSAAVSQPIDTLMNDARTKQIAKQICSKLFRQPFKTDSAAIAFAFNLYDLYCGRFSIPIEMLKFNYPPNSIDFSIAFDTAQLKWLDLINGASDFLEKGAARDTLGIQATVAAPLLADFITTTSDVINHTKQADAILRFTHAEAISPFATLLGIPQASVPAASIYQYNQHWSAESIIPLSANIQWIVYSNGSKYLVKVLLNEKETRLPVPTLQYPYYKWEDVKEFYLKKLRSI
jgi:multiple inositol-polyphosphate phosphatase / 2,3-bisphosphoglycerate 3-phosphatase